MFVKGIENIQEEIVDVCCLGNGALYVDDCIADIVCGAWRLYGAGRNLQKQYMESRFVLTAALNLLSVSPCLFEPESIR
jgi:hypothetical protein